MLLRRARYNFESSPGIALLANYRLDMDNVGEYSIVFNVETPIPWDVVAEDPSGLLVSGDTTITAPTGTVYGIATGYTRDNNTANAFGKIILKKNGAQLMTQGNHNGDYFTLIVAGAFSCSAGDTFVLAAVADGTTSDILEDSAFTVAFYG